MDTSAAEKIPGVTAVRVIPTPAKRCSGRAQEIAAVAADTEEIARDAVSQNQGRIRSVAAPGSRRRSGEGRQHAPKPAGEQVTGDPDKAFKDADVVVRRHLRHPGDHALLPRAARPDRAMERRSCELWPSTQNVSGIGSDLGKALEVPAAKIHVEHAVHRRRVRQQVRGGSLGVQCASSPRPAAASR